jgi:tetratricopeptide (TPR) repeat protein
MKKQNLVIAVIVSMVCIGSTLPAHAQSQYREYYIHGQVVDTDKNPLPKVKITLQDTNTSRKYGTKTNKKGEFRLAGLPHGIYSVTMEKEGYQTRTDEWRFETPQNRMQKVKVKTTVMVSEGVLKEMKRSKKLEEMFQAASEMVRKRDFESALEVLDKMLAEKADDSNALYLKGICLINKQRHPEAVVTLSKVVQLSPSFAGAHFQLGVALQRSGEMEKALVSYQKGLKLEPKNLMGVYNSGIILYGLNKSHDAVAYFEDALLLKPGDPDILEMAGLCYLKLEKYDKALEYLEKAKEAAKDPEKIKSLEELVNDLKKQLQQ